MISKYSLLATLRKTGLLFSKSFFVLYLLTKLDYQFLGVVFAAAYLFEAFTDYPSGVLSDRFGYRKVLFFAFLLYGASYFVLGYALTPYDLIGVVILQALANGQDSGALQSWFDNNYEKIAIHDPDRTDYLRFMNKNTVMVDLIGFGGGVLGGYLAVMLPNGRITVFFIQGVFMVYLGFVFLLTVQNYYETVETPKESYLASLFQGVGFILFNPKILVLTVGLSMVLIAKSLWLALLMMPIYYGYVGNDFYLSILNFTVFFLASIYVIIRSKKWKKQNINARLPFVKFLHAVLFFPPLYFVLKYYPITNSLQLVPIAILIVIGTFSSAYLTFDKVLTYRLLLDIVPADKRNGFYSFLPTFSLIFASVLNYFAGSYINQNGYSNVILGLMGIELFGAICVGLVILLGVASLQRKITFDEDIPYIFDSSLSTTLESRNLIRPSPMYIGETAKRIWLSMTAIAKKDDIISEEELDLLIYAMEQMQEYLQNFEYTFNDGIVTPEEFKNLDSIRTKMREKVTTFAEKSNGISADEDAILTRIDQIIDELQIIEKSSMKQ